MRRRKYGAWIATAVAVLVIVVIGLVCGRQESIVFDDPTFPYLTLHTVEAGERDCVIVELPDHRVLMIDSGSADRAEAVGEYLKGLSVSHLDALIFTQSSPEAVGGLPRLAQAFSIEKVYLPKTQPRPDGCDGLEVVAVDGPLCLLDEGEVRVELIDAAVCITYRNNRFVIADAPTQDADLLVMRANGAPADAAKVDYAVVPDAMAELGRQLKARGAKVYDTSSDGAVAFLGNGEYLLLKR